MKHLLRFTPLALLAGVIALTGLPATALEKGRPEATSPRVLNRLSQSVQIRYFLNHPEEAPESIRALEEAAAVEPASAPAAAPSGLAADVLNDDDVGFPQNEESVSACRRAPRFVVEGANEYRGLLDPVGNFTGYYLSTDGGRTLAKEGVLPALRTAGETLPSGGDPVVQMDDRCNVYMASLNYGADPFAEGANGIGLYRTSLRNLRNCPAGEDPDRLTQPRCWPTRRFAASAGVAGGVGAFLDKPWMDVGQSGAAGNVVWAVFSDFALDVNEPLGFTGAQIKAVRCSGDLSSCTQPILISGTDEDVQFADVTITESGRTLITWAQIEGELEETAQTFTVKARIAPPGSTTFGPTRIVSRETNPIPFGGFMHANDWRVATYPKSIAPKVNGRERLFVLWDRCRFRLLDSTCEEAEIVMSQSSNDGRDWSEPKTISAGGDNYFPAISDEVGNRRFVAAWFTNRFDRVFHNRQDVEVVTINGGTGNVVRRQRVTKVSNESEADPLLGGFFIGDYIDVHLIKDRVYVAYNANYRSIKVLGQGFPIPQQDNYLARVRP